MPKPSKSNPGTLQEKREEKTYREFIPVEMSLERIAFFTPSKNGANELAEKVIEHEDLRVSLRISPSIGLPVTSDQDLYRAFQLILKEHVAAGHSFLKPLEVPTNRLLRYAGKQKNERIIQEVRRWLDRMAFVGIKATYRPGKKGKPLTIRGTVFDTILSPGEEFEETGEIAETNYVWLSRWYLSNIASGYVRTLDIEFHNQLRKPIAKAVYPLLQTGWYASTRREKTYTKRYSHLCEMFLLERYSAVSRIKQQLDPSFEELKKTGFLASWSYRPSKTDSKDWVISWTPGPKYLDDIRLLRERKEIALRIKEGMPQEAPPDPLGYQELMLLEDVLEVCRDAKSEAGYRRVIQSYPESVVRAALSETKLAAHQRKIRKSKGAYFMDTLKRLKAMRNEAVN